MFKVQIPAQVMFQPKMRNPSQCRTSSIMCWRATYDCLLSMTLALDECKRVVNCCFVSRDELSAELLASLLSDWDAACQLCVAAIIYYRCNKSNKSDKRTPCSWNKQEMHVMHLLLWVWLGLAVTTLCFWVPSQIFMFIVYESWAWEYGMHMLASQFLCVFLLSILF